MWPFTKKQEEEIKLINSNLSETAKGIYKSVGEGIILNRLHRDRGKDFFIPIHKTISLFYYCGTVRGLKKELNID